MKYREGFYIGDVLSFESLYQFRNDNIFKKGRVVAKLKTIKCRLVDKVVYIQSLDGKKLGSYVEK